MTWLCLREEVAAEMRAYADHELVRLLAIGDRTEPERRAHQRAKVGRHVQARADDRRRDRAASDARRDEIARSGDVRALRAYEARVRAHRRRA